MKKTEKFFIGVALGAVIVVMAGVFWRHVCTQNNSDNHTYPTTDFGAFLAAQHAIYVNDFEHANQFANAVSDTEYTTVQNTRYLASFLGGEMPQNAKLLKDEKSVPARLIYDAYLVTEDKWSELYDRHKKDDAALSAPLRIWASVASDKKSDALKFIDKLQTNDAWKAFVRGQIYAETGEPDRATREFANVPADFMNINDYMYVMSFYRAHEMFEDADILRDDFVARPGGMFMAGYDNIPDWSVYSGYKNALAFSLLQTVSHTQIMMYSDLSMLLLRFAQVTAPEFGGNNDAINYYLGQFFFNNTGDYAAYFNKIAPDSPFYPFGVLRMAEKSNNVDTLNDMVRDNPLFVPAVNKLVAHHVQHGNRRAALRVINRALKNKDLGEIGRAFFLKGRAHIYFTFGDLDAAQADIYDAAAILPIDAEILSLQAKIWAAQNREIENAYEYAMTLIQQNPTDISAWDTMGRVVATREGNIAALEVLERVGDISATCSALFEHLGDLYATQGDNTRARAAYMRAIDLSGDGQTILPKLKKKLRKVK